MRIENVRDIAARKNIFPYVVFDLKNIRYLTSFAGSNGYLVFLKEKTVFITDSRYEEYAASIIPQNVEIVIQKGSFFSTLEDVIPKASSTLYVEEHSTVLSSFIALQKAFPSWKIESGGDIVNELRAVKDDSEIALMRKAVDIADKCFSHLAETAGVQMTEWDLVMEAGMFYQMNGCRRMSFDPIIASGAASSMPHYFPSMTKRIGKGEMLLIDMGCEYEGYNSDLTRTPFISEIPEGFDKIYNTVLEAQLKAIAGVKSGITTGELDSIARGHISDAGYGDYFGHSLGHGVGLDIHEMPAVKSGGEYVLQAGNLITIEPGIYLPGKGGVRIEDIVLVTDQGCEILTRSDKNIKII